MMRILVAHNYYQQSGGEDTVVEAEIEMLTNHGHHVATHFCHNDAIEGMHPLTIAGKTIWNRKAGQEMEDAVKREQIDVVHFYNTFPLMSPSVYYAARKQGAAVVQTLHNYRLLCPNALFFREGQACEDCLGKAVPWPSVKHKCYRDSTAASAVTAAMLTAHRAMGTWQNAVDAYIALTNFGQDKFIRGGLPADRLFVKPNFLSSDPKPRQGGGGYAVFVGRLSQEKGIDLLLDAWCSSKNRMPLKIVGDGPQAARVQAVAAGNNQVQWLGRRDFDQVCDIIGDAACLIAPSLCYEGAPRTIVEAFALGTPVIAPQFGSMMHMIDHEKNGMSFEVGNHEDLVRQVLWMMQHREHWQDMRVAARSEYEANYTADRNYKMLMEIYDRVTLQAAIHIDQARGAA
jgi:glycosyltransferase involved in cell wall biosynthesis